MNTTTVYAPAKKKARVEIIPLIDVVFFLLATFVLFTLSLDKIASLQVKLPVAPPILKPDNNALTIQASADGTMYWKEGDRATPELISHEELAPRLATYISRTQVPRVLVRGDNTAKFGAAVGIFDEVRRAGIEQVSIETIPSKTGS
jgi:biopolymer transport protein ExbD